MLAPCGEPRRVAQTASACVALMESEHPSSELKAGLPSHNVGLIELFLLFSQLGLSSFGGAVSAWMHRDFVQRRQLINETEFLAAMALCRLMPGATVVNLAVVIGKRLRGAAGATTAVLGLLLGPCLVVVAFAVVYRRFAGVALLHTALEGLAAASVGLMLAMGASLANHVVGFRRGSGGGAARKAAAFAVVAATFVLVGVLRLPMVPVVLCLTPLSVSLAYVLPAPPRLPKASDAGG
jgi:chromate transporter